MSIFLLLKLTFFSLMLMCSCRVTRSSLMGSSFPGVRGQPRHTSQNAILRSTAKLVFPHSCRLMHVFVANYLQNIIRSSKRGLIVVVLFFKSGQACNITSESFMSYRQCVMFTQLFTSVRFGSGYF